MKRPPQERKRLTPELEAFAASDQTRLRIRRPAVDQGRVADPREGYAIAGVANRDARSVYGSRVDELRELWNAGAASDADKAVIGERLLDLKRLSLWRARRVMGFDALVEEVLGIPVAEATALCDAAAARLAEPATELSERDVALWLRTEAGLFEGDPKARASVRGGVLHLSIALTAASLGLAGAGAKHMPLARAQRESGDGAGAAEASTAEAPAAPLVQVPAEPAGARLLRRKPAAEPVAEAELDDDAASEPDEAELEVAPERPKLAARPERPRREGGRPAFQQREGARPERPRRDGDRPAFQKRDGDRPAFQKRDGDRPAFQKRDGDRPAFQKRDGDRPAFQKRDGGRPERPRRDGDRPAFQKRDGDRPAFQKRDGDRPAFQKRDGDRPAFQKRTGGSEAGAKRPFTKKPAFGKGAQGGGKSFGKGKPSFGKGKGFGERKSFGGRPESGAASRIANKPFKKKPSDDEG